MTTNFTEARLIICNACQFNINGDCAFSGKEVLNITATEEETCPAVPSRWGSLSTPTTGQIVNQGICIPCSKR